MIELKTTNKLQGLVQDETGRIYRENRTLVRDGYLVHVGKIMTLVVENFSDLEKTIDEMVERGSAVVPNNANAYVVSDFNGITQHSRKNEEKGKEKMCSVYAVQFYRVF